MASDWTSLKDIVRIKGGKRLPKGSALQTEENTHPYIRVRDMGSKRIPKTGLEYVPDDVFPKIKNYIVEENDVIISIVGSVGLVSVIDQHFHLASQTENCAKLSGLEKTDAEYLYYCLTSPAGQREIAVQTVGAVQPKLPLYGIENIQVPWPQKDERSRIAHILGTLDDKIELNRQMNATLEAMSLALFKSWFVDFDPVIDNAVAVGNPIPEPLQAHAEARKALDDQRKSLPEAIQNQFPNRFVFNDDLGWVPEGWKVSTIGEEVDNTGGGTPSTKDPNYWEEGIHAFCTPKDMSTLGSIVLMDTERHLTEAGVNKISSGQLPKGTVLMSSRAPIGYLAISDIPVSVNQGIIAMLPNEKYSSMYLLNWAHYNMYAIKDRANGSTFLEISKKNFRPIPFLVPNEQVSSFFNKQAQAIYDKLLVEAEQIRELSKIRDTLLPKLLSGQLRIPEAKNPVTLAI